VFSVNEDMTVEQVAVTLQVDITYRGNMSLELVSPFGTISKLMVARARDRSKGWSWTFTTVASWGERANGTWLLRFATTSSTGTVKTASVKFYGH
jgi:subtilisin-like proprotein convertase family protein